MNSYNTDIFFSNYYNNLQSVHFESSVNIVFIIIIIIIIIIIMIMIIIIIELFI